MRQLYACVANESTLSVIDHYRNNDAVTRFYSGRYRAYENSPICLLAPKNVQQAHNNLPWMSAFYVITFQAETAMYFCIFAVLMQIREVILPQYWNSLALRVFKTVWNGARDWQKTKSHGIMVGRRGWGNSKSVTFQSSFFVHDVIKTSPWRQAQILITNQFKGAAKMLHFECSTDTKSQENNVVQWQ